MSVSKTAVIIGVGPHEGLGAKLCERFAQLGLHVVIAGRTPEKVEAVAASIRGAGGSATAIRADATVEADVVSLFEQAAAVGNPIDLAIYNPGNNMPGNLVDMEADYFEECWRLGCYGGFLFAREAAKRMLPNEQGTVLFTGASASMRGKPDFYAFTSAKGALRNFLQAMARDLGPQGIHVGHVVIDGAINGEKIATRFPQFYAERGEDGMIGLEAIVDSYQFLYEQPRNGWTLELDIRVHKENF